ncbi:MAG: HAMP domain-containing sensor histidine kinase [Eubacteriales bacterium]|nr:HAMP domain-containing sensor histidine kinase [Eubacteriales bacterium]
MIAYLLIISIAFSAVAFSLIQLVGEYLFTQRVKDDQRIADNLADQVADACAGLNAAAMYDSALSASSEEGSRVLILDPYGVVQVDSESVLNGNRFQNRQAQSVLNGQARDYGFYDTESTSGRLLQDAFTAYTTSGTTGLYASAIKADDVLLGVLVYISNTREIYLSLKQIQGKTVLWLVLVATAALILCMFVIRMITVPIGELNEGISRMSAGDLSARVRVRGKTEFSQLAAAFNSMSERIERQDKTRSQFVSNASHELKTPLSTMKILMETLIYQEPMDPAMTKEFLKDCNAEIDRLNRIVSDLLTLASVDSGNAQFNRQELRLKDLILEQARRLSPLARERGIELECSVKDSVEVSGDSFKLAQVIYNVIDNAIKYTPRGGSVRVDLFRQGKKAVIRISDTGIGIPAEDLPHIFDRFYRVDKARSRETGGTGLGLSIVKQIVLMHDGDITASSVENEGTTFTIELPALAKKAD